MLIGRPSDPPTCYISHIGGGPLRLKVFEGIEFEKLQKVVPSRFLSAFSGLPRGGVFSLVIFSTDDVILSGAAKKAIKRLSLSDETRTYLALGYCFTVESTAVLTEHGFQIVRLHDFHWTDESYQRVTI